MVRFLKLSFICSVLVCCSVRPPEPPREVKNIKECGNDPQCMDAFIKSELARSDDWMKRTGEERRIKAEAQFREEMKIRDRIIASRKSGPKPVEPIKE